MITADGLSKGYRGHAALDGVSFAIEAGERVAILGGNGAGKTTLLRCLMGLTRFEGSLSVDGLDPHRSGQAVRARIGYVPQRPPVGGMQVGDFVDLISELRGAGPEQVDRALAQFGLSRAEHGQRTLSELSGGMLQQVMLAMVTGLELPVLILDEPTANLDAEARSTVLDSLRAIPASTTLLVTSHRSEDVEHLADRAIVLSEGRIDYDGPLPVANAGAGS